MSDQEKSEEFGESIELSGIKYRGTCDEGREVLLSIKAKLDAIHAKVREPLTGEEMERIRRDFSKEIERIREDFSTAIVKKKIEADFE